MNKKIFEKLIKAPPADQRKRYIFLSDNKAICEAIVTVDFSSVYISAKNSEFFFDADSFCGFLREKSNTGTSLIEYVFVLACFRKKTNDQIEEALRSTQLEYKVGAYTLFRDKEYLGKYDFQDELEKTLSGYINRYEGPNETGVDKEQFIKRNPDGKEIGIMEKRLVDYIIETVNFFVVSSVVYIYQEGVYREDIKPLINDF